MNMETPDIRAELADKFETASKSTGPRTPEGKQRSSQNPALRTAFDNMKPDHPMYEALKRELIQSAMHEISDLVKEYRLYLDEYVQTTRVARVASMAPTVGQWLAIVREQNALERLFDGRSACAWNSRRTASCTAPHPRVWSPALHPRATRPLPRGEGGPRRRFHQPSRVG